MRQDPRLGIRGITDLRRMLLMNAAARVQPADPVSSLVGRDEAIARLAAALQPPYTDTLTSFRPTPNASPAPDPVP